MTPNQPDVKCAQKIATKFISNFSGDSLKYLVNDIAQALTAERKRVLDKAAAICREYDEVTNTGTNERYTQKKTTTNVNGFAYAVAIEKLKQEHK